MILYMNNIIKNFLISFNYIIFLIKTNLFLKYNLVLYHYYYNINIYFIFYF